MRLQGFPGDDWKHRLECTGPERTVQLHGKALMGTENEQKVFILETVASFDTWIWHAFFGVPGAQNDLNVIA